VHPTTVGGVRRGAGDVVRPLAPPVEQTLAAARGTGALAIGRFALPLSLALYALFDRGFAYFHVPGTLAYVGECVLALLVLTCLFSPSFVTAGVRGVPHMVVLLMFVFWGVIRVIPNFGEFGVNAVRDSSLWYYALFAWPVIALCTAFPSLPQQWATKYRRFLPILLTWSPVAFALSSATSPTVPDSTLSIFAHRVGNIGVQAAVAAAFLWFAYPRGMMRRVLLLVALLIILVVGTQNRGALVAATAGLVFALLLDKHRLRLILGVALVTTGAIVMASALDLSVPGNQGRQVSATQLVLNVVSLGGGVDEGNLSNNVQFRTQLWSTAIDKTAQRGQIIDGWGFGENVFQALGFVGNENPPLRSPHNSHMDVFVRMGLIGLTLWALFWVMWYASMLRARKRLLAAGDSARGALIAVLVVGVTVTLVNAYFDPTLEGAQVAIWLWALVGLGTALAHPKPTQLVRQHTSSKPERLRGSKLRQREPLLAREPFRLGTPVANRERGGRTDIR
jgi:hypothetical protein